jgi:hypothetical protein
MIDLIDYSEPETYTSSDFDTPFSSKKVNPFQYLLSEVDTEETKNPFTEELSSTKDEDTTPTQSNTTPQRPFIVRKNIPVKLKQQTSVTKLGMNFARRGR